MNKKTRRLVQFVLYSIRELAMAKGAGFWSNDAGWVEFKDATRFTVDSVPLCNVPVSQSRDAQWIMWVPELSAMHVARTRPARSFSAISAY